MADDVKTKTVRLSLLAEQAENFRAIQKLLGHDSPEQTFEKMLQLLQAALLLRYNEQSKIRLYTRDASKVAQRVVSCPQCDHRFTPPVVLESDGFRETVVDLS